MPFATVGTTQLYYERVGAGTPLVLVSGTGWSGEHWKLEQVPYFSRDHDVIVFDHRGTGRSDHPAGQYSTELFADELAELLDAIAVTQPVHLLGHSMGGRVCQWFALKYPERVRALVLAASGPGQIDDARPSYRGISPDLVAEFVRLGWPGYNEEHLRGSNMFHRASSETIERFVGTHRGQFGTNLVSYLRHLDARQRHESTARLGEIVAPTLCIVGSEDTYGDPSHFETTRYLADHIADTEFVCVDGVAHALHIEAADEFNAAVGDFLSRH